MHRNHLFILSLAGAAAGAVNGLFGAGGGMILVPLLGLTNALSGEEIFPASISIILPICMVSLISTALQNGLDIRSAFPYLIGSGLGGLLAGRYGRKIPVLRLHQGLGILILWGGFRYLIG